MIFISTQQLLWFPLSPTNCWRCPFFCRKKNQLFVRQKSPPCVSEQSSLIVRIFQMCHKKVVAPCHALEGEEFFDKTEKFVGFFSWKLGMMLIEAPRIVCKYTFVHFTSLRYLSIATYTPTWRLQDTYRISNINSKKIGLKLLPVPVSLHVRSPSRFRSRSPSPSVPIPIPVPVTIPIPIPIIPIHITFPSYFPFPYPSPALPYPSPSASPSSSPSPPSTPSFPYPHILPCSSLPLESLSTPLHKKV